MEMRKQQEQNMIMNVAKQVRLFAVFPMRKSAVMSVMPIKRCVE